MCCVLLLAFLSNSLILFSVKFLRKSPTPNLRLCISLAVSDAWTALLMCCGLVVNSYLPVVRGYVMDSYLCWVLFFEMVRVAAMLTSDIHLFALGLNHWYSIFAPFRYKVEVTSRRCKLCILLLWAIPILGIYLWFGGIPGQGFLADCDPAFYTKLPFRLTIFFLFSVPLILTLLIYAYILRHLWKSTGIRITGTM